MLFFVVYSSVHNVFWHHNIEHYLNYTIKKNVWSCKELEIWLTNNETKEPDVRLFHMSFERRWKNSLLPPCSKCRSCSRLWFSSLFRTNSEWSKKMALRFFFKCSLEYKEIENCKISWWQALDTVHICGM